MGTRLLFSLAVAGPEMRELAAAVKRRRVLLGVTPVFDATDSEVTGVTWHIHRATLAAVELTTGPTLFPNLCTVLN